MAENSAIVAEYSARKRIVAEYSAKLWPRFWQEKRNMAEVSANSRGCQFDKQT